MRAPASRRPAGLSLAGGALIVSALAGLHTDLALAQPVARAAALTARPEAMTNPAFARGAATLQPVFATSGTRTDTPPLEPARIAGQLFAGAYAGIAGYFIGHLAGTVVAETFADAGSATRDRIGFAFGIVGAGVATAATVSAVGNIGDQTGSYPATMLGTAAGGAAAFLLNRMLYGQARLPSDRQSSRMRWVEASFEALLPSLGATIAFNSTRQYK